MNSDVRVGDKVHFNMNNITADGGIKMYIYTNDLISIIDNSDRFPIGLDYSLENKLDSSIINSENNDLFIYKIYNETYQNRNTYILYSNKKGKNYYTFLTIHKNSLYYCKKYRRLNNLKTFGI